MIGSQGSAIHNPSLVSQPVNTADGLVRPRLTTGMPAPILFAFLFAVPLWILGWVDVWKPSDGKLLIVFVSGPLFVACCCAPLIYLRAKHQQSVSIVFMVACLIYLMTFGIRAYYIVAFPDVTLFPNFDVTYDLLWLHKGLLWGAAGIAAMTFGFFTVRPTINSDALRRRTLISRADALLGGGSRVWFILGLYFLGLLGRAYQLQTGAALYIYNSPAFDLIGTRDDSLIGGPASLMADFCPLAFGAMIAYYLNRGRQRSASPSLLKLTLLAMFLTELLYFSYGSYKFGLLGTLLIPWIVSSTQGKQWSKVGILLGLAFVLVVLPVINSSREKVTPFYLQESIRPSSEWFDYMNQAAKEAYVDEREFGARYFLDPFFFRLTGAEALAVSTKFTPDLGYEWGKSYLSFVKLAVPRIIRPWSSEVDHIPWEVKYVGFLSTNFTVVPMPAIVEAYLNFGIVGVLVVMFLLGVLYRCLDSFSVLAANNSFAGGLYAYVAWRVLNIEHNLFIVLLPLIKIAAVVFFLCWIAKRAGLKHPVRVRTS